MAQHTYELHEAFRSFYENCIPCGLQIEKNSVYTHNHVRIENGTFYITCKGNYFFTDTPALRTFSADMELGFHNVESGSALRILTGYDRKTRNGCLMDFIIEDRMLEIQWTEVRKRKYTVLDTVKYAYPGQDGAGKCPERFKVTIAVGDTTVSGMFDGCIYSFELPEGYREGLMGFTFQGSVGELAAYDVCLYSNDAIVPEVLHGRKTVTLSLREGGNMPYTLSYGVKCYQDRAYLEYSFDGGAQYREKYSEYPRVTGQYTVEQAVIRNPYIALYDSETGKLIQKAIIYRGEFTAADPGLIWKVLLAYFNVQRLPLDGSFGLPANLDYEKIQIAVGYEKIAIDGYEMQAECNLEKIFDFVTGNPVSEGTARGIEHIEVHSFSSGTADRIPKDVYDRPGVLHHLENNHFFDDTEEILFEAKTVTDKDDRFLSMSAELLDVYGDKLDDMSMTSAEGNCYRFTYTALPVGVYRVRFHAGYGDRVFLVREIVFEVYDPAGEKCAPLESGLPVLFSMPNEQKYLDRDAFDLYNPSPDCNMEHFYAVSAMSGDIGMRKRIWETNRIFGRKWYVWDSYHRTITKEEFRKYGEDLIRYSDYCYYPLPKEWAVMRHDLVSFIGFFSEDSESSIMGEGILEYLKDFLEEYPECRNDIDITDGSVTQEKLDPFLALHMKQWLDYVIPKIREDLIRNTEWMRSINPKIKRACYGPFNIYASPITTHHGCRYLGMDPEDNLADMRYDGFAQLEDYPYSCTYHTYVGAYFMMHALLHHPGICIYPEEYTASRGGCIDGAVKNAHPPLGRYDMPAYFNVTHSYEYVYNTAHLTPEGFRYWDKRGFMQRDFTNDFAEAFVRGWKHVKQHEPAHPLRSMAYLSEIPLQEDNWKWKEDNSWVSNRSNCGISYVFETARKSGLPGGFAVTYETLMNLTDEQTDCIVLPSLKYASEEVIRKIKELYAQGVALTAVSDVTGLEDLFGVRENHCEQEIYRLTAGGVSESVYPETVSFYYEPTDAEVLLWAEDGEGRRFPALFRKGKTLLLNGSVDEMGRQSFDVIATHFYAANISELLRSTLSDALRKLYVPVALADNCGITLLKDQSGNILLLAVNYENYEFADPQRTWEAEIRLHLEKVEEVETIYGEQPAVLKENREVKGIHLSLHHQECALYRLIEK